MCAAKSRPNIVLFLADQLRRNALGCYGAADAATPHIDALAASGVTFDAACSSFPVCVPYRFTLMTGLRALTRDVPCLGWRMSPAERTIADAFNENGYDTIYLGKWHLFGANPEESGWVPPDHRGRFGTWEGFEKVNDHFRTDLYGGSTRDPQRYEGFQTDVLVDRALALLKERRSGKRTKNERPFLFVLSVEPPHPPLGAPREYEQRRRAMPPTLPPNFLFRETDTGPEPKLPARARDNAILSRQIYQAMVDNLDDNVGRFVAGIDALGLADETVLLFTADHGQMDGAHALPNSVKRNPYEESVGVPLIVRDPRRKASAGMRAAEPVGTEDLFPTLLGLAGIAPMPGLPGLDLAGLLDAPARALDRTGLLLYLTHHFESDHPWYRRGWRALRTREHLFACWGPRASGIKPWHLYDLKADPWQMNDLVKRDAPAVARFTGLLRDTMAEAGDHLGFAA
ncbi:MAG: sulfatase-like hydrolase/transferase [Dongiaceae bacterium]